MGAAIDVTKAAMKETISTTMMSLRHREGVGRGA